MHVWTEVVHGVQIKAFNCVLFVSNLFIVLTLMVSNEALEMFSVIVLFVDQSVFTHLS